MTRSAAWLLVALLAPIQGRGDQLLFEETLSLAPRYLQEACRSLPDCLMPETILLDLGAGYGGRYDVLRYPNAILISKDEDLGSLLGQSLQVHEYIHYLQAKAGRFPLDREMTCHVPGDAETHIETEREAWETQAAWLRRRGIEYDHSGHMLRVVTHCSAWALPPP